MRQDLARSARSKTVLLRTVQRKQGAAAASSLLKGMVEEDVEVNVFHYNTVISGWAAEGDLERAIETFAQMRERHVKASIVSYGALCGIEWRHGMQILQQLEAENLEPNAILLTSAAAALQQGQKWEVAVGALHSLMIRQVLTNVICQNSVANASAKAVQWWAAAGQHSFGFHQLRLQPKCLEQCVSNAEECNRGQHQEQPDNGQFWCRCLH